MSLLTRKEYAGDEDKKRDFWIGFVGWFLGNVVLCLLQWFGSALLLGMVGSFDQGGDVDGALINALSVVLAALPWVLNLGIIIFFAFTRSQIALGMLAAFGAAIALVIIVGVVTLAACFVLTQSYNP